MKDIKNGVYSPEEAANELKKVHEASESPMQEMEEDKMGSHGMDDMDY